MTDAERDLAYAEAQVDHPDPQLRPLLAAVFGPGLSRLRSIAEEEWASREDRAPIVL